MTRNRECPWSELCPGSRYIEMPKCSRPQMRPATDFINWCYKVKHQNSSHIPILIMSAPTDPVIRLKSCPGHKICPFPTRPGRVHSHPLHHCKKNSSHYGQYSSVNLHLTSCAGGRHNMPPPQQVDLWPFDFESAVRVTCGVGSLCAEFSLPRPLCSRLRPDVRDRQRDRRQTRIIS